MNFNDVKNKDIKTACEESLSLAKASQAKLNAVVSFVEVEQQVKELSNKNANSPLFGVPIVLKDNVSTKGILTSASSRILSNYIPIYDATITKKLKEAGAIVIAKSSMDELGMGGTNLNAYTGKVNNPYDVNRISGGSSGGSAALVAQGVVPFAIGTDTGDSVRKPASYCGIVGVKPTYGRISRYGIIPYASSLDHVGYFTTNVSDASSALEVLAGRDDLDMTSSNQEVQAYSKLLDSNVAGKKIAILVNVQEAIEDTTITNSFNHIMNTLKEKGAIVEEVRMNDDYMKALLPTYYVLSNAEATANHSNLDGVRFGVREEGADLVEIMINSRTKGFSSDVRKRFVIGSYSLHVDNQEKLYKKAQKVRRVIVDELKTIMNKYDVIVASSSGTIAPLPNQKCGEDLSVSHLVAENHMLLGNFSGFPSMSLPQVMVNKMPVGISVMAKAFDEVNMFNIAKAIEEITGLENIVVGGDE